MRNRVDLSGSQKQYLTAAAAAQSLDYDVLWPVVESQLMSIIGHRNTGPTKARLQAAIDAALAEM